MYIAFLPLKTGHSYYERYSFIMIYDINSFIYLNNETLKIVYIVVTKLLQSNYISLKNKILIRNISNEIYKLTYYYSI